MAYVVDWIARNVYVPSSDLTLVSGTRYSLNMTDFLIEIRRLESAFDGGLWAAQILVHDNTRLDFAGADYAPFDKIINDYTMTFDPSVTRVDLLGSNNNIIDVFIANGVSVVPSNSAGLQRVTTGSGLSAAQDATLERLNYMEAAVYVDTDAGENGDGSEGSPFNIQSDAADYAESKKIRTIVVLSDIVLERNSKNFTVIGSGFPTIDTNGQEMNKAKFLHCQMEGTYTGRILVEDSILKAGFHLNGVFENCGTLETLVCPAGAEALMRNCSNSTADLSHTDITVQGDANLSVHKADGRYTIKGCSHPNAIVSFTLTDGHLIFDGTNTDGNMIALGSCDFDDFATAAGANVINRVHSTDFLMKVVTNKRELLKNGSVWELIVYDDDGVTPILNKELKDKDGNDISDLAAGVLAQEAISSV